MIYLKINLTNLEYTQKANLHKVAKWKARWPWASPFPSPIINFLDSNGPAQVGLLRFLIHPLTEGINIILKRWEEGGNIHMDSCLHDFPLKHLRGNQLGSQLVGRPQPAKGKLLARELFAFGWVPPKRGGEDRGQWVRGLDGCCGSASFGKWRLLKVWKKKPHIQTSEREASTSHISTLGQNEYHPLKRLVSAITTE